MQNWCILFPLNLILIVIGLIAPALASAGDRSTFFVNCVRGCSNKNCTSDGLGFSSKSTTKQEYWNHLMLWSCEDECVYHCMWQTTDAFLARKWPVPQFYGKWPFRRLFGMQEPASVLFSLMNFAAHWMGIKEFRRRVRSTTSMYYAWHIFCGICLNGWFWSTVFHTRDYPLTELFDYGFAYSIVLAMTSCMVLRMLHNRSSYIKLAMIVVTAFYFINHFAHLSVGNFSYSYNMKANIVTGTIGGIGWVAWCAWQWKRRRQYIWKMLLFQCLAGASLSLELLDFPPIWWTFDAHSLWHLSTAPLTVLLYSFFIDDCKSLSKSAQADALEAEKEKLI